MTQQPKVSRDESEIKITAPSVDFKKTATDPWKWRSVALSLLNAAEALWKELHPAMNELLGFSSGLGTMPRQDASSDAEAAFVRSLAISALLSTVRLQSFDRAYGSGAVAPSR